MPLTPDMRRSIDQIRDYLFGGGYPDPVSNAEQLSFLFFFYLVEGIDAENKARARVLKTPYNSLFEGDWTLKNPLNAEGNYSTIPCSHFKWSVWAKGLSGEALVRFVRDEVFAFFADMGASAAHNFMHGARLTIDEPTVLTQVVNLVDGLRLDQADSDTKGDLFEHVLRLMQDTVWLRQEQMSQLFGRERSVITKHLRNVFGERELVEDGNVQNLHIAGSDKPVKFYNLDVIISVGYRVKSVQGTRFRQWATTVLRQHLTQGYTLNRQRREANARELEAALQLVRKAAQSPDLQADTGRGLVDIVTRYA
jgi:hypothetical protein